MDAWRFHGLVQVLVEIGEIENHLEDGGADAIGAPRSHRQHRIAVVQDDSGSHHGADALARRALVETIGM